MIREIIARPQVIAWLPWAVQYFFFIGLACSGIVVAAWLRWRHAGAHPRLELAALALALVSGIVAPLALSADLHQPARIWHFYAYFTPWSWMSLGSLFLPIFTMLSGGYFLLLLRNQLRDKTLPRWGRLLLLKPEWQEARWLPVLALLALLSAFSILLYTGREVTVLRAQPLWYSLWLPWLIFFTALQALPPLLALWLRQEPQWQPRLARYQLLALLALVACLVGWLIGGSTSAAVALRLPARGGIWLIASIAFGGLIVLLLASALWARRHILSTSLLILQGASALLLCWGVRWMLLMQTQTLPKFNIVENPYSLPLGSDGLLAIVGTLGLWVTLIIAVRELLHGLMESKQHG